MVISVFAACGKGNKPSVSNQTTPKPDGGIVDPGNGGEEIPENEQLNLDLDSIDHESAVVTVFHWKPQDDNVEFGMEADAINNDAVNDAIYKRNSYTEEGLGITFDWVEQDSTFTKMTAYINKLRARISDPMTPVDIVAAQAKGMPCLITEGLLTDVNTYSDSLDLDKAWWPEDCQDVLAVKDKIYFVSGDISPNLLRMMTVLFVNKTTLAARGYDYNTLMEQVKSYNWTLDDLIEMTTGVYEDLDNVTAGPSVGDKFGLISTYFHTDAIFAGLGYRFMVKSSKDDYSIEMFDIIRDSIVFDVGRIYEWFIALESGSGVRDELVSYAVAGIISKSIMYKTSFTFNSQGDPVRRQVDQYVDSANKKLIDYINS